MASPPVLNIEELLFPIAADRPSGRSLAYEPEYDAIREARRSDDDTPQGDWQRRAKSAQWDRVVALGTAMLKGQTKDLQVAAWVAEALARLHGFAGLRDGLTLIRAIQDRFWDSYFPEVEDGDVESRSGPHLFLDAVLPMVIRSIPLTAGYDEAGYSFLRWEESRATDNLGLKDPDLMEARIAEGKLAGKQFDDAVAQTPRGFYSTLDDDLRASLDAFKELDRSVDEHFGRDAPGLVNIRKAIEDCRRPVEPILAAKRAEEPDPEDDAESPEAESGGDEWSSTGLQETEPNGEDEAPRPARRPAPPRVSGGPIASAEDAYRRIVEAAAYLRKNEPTSPVPFLVIRALRQGELHATPDPSQAEAPSSETRQALRRLAAEGSWEELLEGAEGALSRPEGRAWLDPHRFAILAMEASGEVDRSAASAAVRDHLRSTLAAFPNLDGGELCDGTPTASGDTRAWLRGAILPPPDRDPGFVPPPTFEPSAEGDPNPDDVDGVDVMDRAIAAVRDGRSGEGLELIRRAMRSAQSGRDRFLRKLQMAELCLMVNNARLALPLAEDLARQVDEFHLEDWEEERLGARVWAVLYRCLRAGGAVVHPERTREVFARLCRLDIGQALAYGGEDDLER